MSDANSVSIKVCPEVTPGTTPTNSTNWFYLPHTGKTLAGVPETVVSQQIRTDRMLQDMMEVSRQPGITIDFEMMANAFDWALEAVARGTWNTDVLKIGTTDRTYSIEVYFQEAGFYLIYKGMKLNTMSLDVAYGQVITGQMGFVGTSVAKAGSSAVGTGTIAAATTAPVMTGSTHPSSVQVDGAPTTVYIEGLTIEMTNNMRPVNTIGNVAPVDHNEGTFGVTGTMATYCGNDDILDHILNNSDSNFDFVLGDGTNTLTITVPVCRFHGQLPEPGTLDTDVKLNPNWTALYDSVSSTNIQFDRT